MSDTKESNKLSTKDIWVYSIATGVVLIGFIITIISLFLPPPGEIHDSVLVVLGQSLLFVAMVFGVSYYVKGKVGEIQSNIIEKIDKFLDSKN